MISSQIATGLTDPLDIAVYGDDLYWTDPTAETVNRMPKGGGGVEPLATGQAKPTHLALDGTYVYWTANLGAAIWRAPMDSSSPPSIFMPAYSPYGIAIAGGQVYWTNTAKDAMGNFTVERVPVAGGTPEILDSDPDQPLWSDLVSNGTAVLATGAAGAARLDGSTVVRLSGDSYNAFATDQTSYYLCSGTAEATRTTDRYDYSNTPIGAPLGSFVGSIGNCQGVCVIATGAGDSCAGTAAQGRNEGNRRDEEGSANCSHAAVKASLSYGAHAQQ